jgi:hypothetical protein
MLLSVGDIKRKQSRPVRNGGPYELKSFSALAHITEKMSLPETVEFGARRIQTCG